MFRKSIPTRLFTTNSILFNCTKLQPIVISRTFIQHVNKNNFSNKLMSPQIQLIDKKYFSNKIKKQELIVNDKKYLSTKNNNKYDNKNIDYYIDKYIIYYVNKCKDCSVVILLILLGLYMFNILKNIPYKCSDSYYLPPHMVVATRVIHHHI